jgi:hypothetical protein
MWLYALIGLLLIVMGLAVHVFKMHFLISGYNTMPVEKRANVDVRSIAKIMGIVFYFDGALLILISILKYVGIKFSVAPVFVIIAVSIVFMLVFLQRYDGNLFDENHKMRPGAIKQMIKPLGFTGLILIVVAGLMTWSIQPLSVVVGDTDFEIKGMYGDTYDYDKVENLERMTVLPKILMRTNGAAIGAHLKGHFKLETLGSVTLFLNTDYNDYIYFEYEGKKFIFNTIPEKLDAIYDTLDEKIN